MLLSEPRSTTDNCALNFDRSDPAMSITKLGDDLMKVLKLDASGTNWVIYKDRFLWAVDARGLLGHVDGTGGEPRKPPVKQVKTTGDDGKVSEEDDPTDEKLTAWEDKLKVWRQGEAVVKQQIAATIPDSLFMKIRGKGSAREIWEAIAADFQNKSRLVSVDLRRRLQQLRCPEKGDVRAHFTSLRTMREDLAAMGHAPADDDFYAIIISSLPASYDPYISALNATSSVMGKYMSSDDLLLSVTEEYDRRVLGRGGKKEENAAFTASESGGSRGAGKQFSGSKCFNCNRRGHKKADCWAKGGGKEGQGLKRQPKESSSDGKAKETPKTAAGTSAAMALGVNVAWMAIHESESEADESDLDERGADFDDAEDDELLLYMSDNESEAETESAAPSDVAYTSTYTREDLETPTNNDLYDSGASRHMSGHRHRFLTFEAIALIRW